MRTQKFGIEIEMTGITRAAAAQVIAGHFGTSAIHVGGSYDTYTVRDNDNRQWKVVSDASIRRESRRGESRNRAYAVEFVSPICKYGDIETIQELIRKLRTAGAKVNDSCGIHVHIDASIHDVKTLRNIVNIMAAKEDLLYKTLKVNVNREHYCAKADTRFLDEPNAKRPTSMDTLESIWYNGPTGRYDHYDGTRYHGLNLHSVFSKGTIEFRLFQFEAPTAERKNGLHAGQLKSYIQLCLALSQMAKAVKTASPKPQQNDNPKYAMRTWLLRLGFIGEEFATARDLLTRRLAGDAAFRNGRAA